MIIKAECGCSFNVKRTFNDGNQYLFQQYAQEIQNYVDIEKLCDKHNGELSANMVKDYKEQQQKSIDKLMGYVYGK